MTEEYRTREERRKQAKKKKVKGKRGAKTIIKRILIVFVALGLIGLIAGASTFAFMVKDAPKLDEKLLKDPISSKIYDKDGNFVTEIGAEKRDYVDYEEIPKVVEDAVLAIEDVRFYKHNGIDLIRLGGAVLANIKEGFGAEGGSTITQQVIKMSFLTPEKTLKRKAQEAWLSLQLEQKYTKEEILEMYVNKIWMDSGGHGIATAAKVYYGKELDDLTISEAALLAGIPQSPANYNPFKHPDRAEKRRNVVLKAMYDNGFITKEEYEEAKAVDVVSTLVPESERSTGEIKHDDFISQVVKEINEKYPDINPFSDGLNIYTTLDTDAQTYLEKMLNSDEIIQFPDEKFQAGITLLDTKTGEIRALGGGRNKEDTTFGFNYATDAKRQPGSTIKPILDYGPAIEYLKWGTYHALEDKPYTYSDGTPINNWDNRHMGVMTMRKALALSRNIPALQAYQAVGGEKAKEFAGKIGIELNEIYESYSIGGFGGKDKGVSTLELAGAFSAFGNNGFYTEPHTVKEIELQDGTKLNMAPKAEVAMQDYTAFMISDMLKDVVQNGTGRRVAVPGLPIAGKTGTTNYTDEEKAKYNIPRGGVPDAWFVGYTTNYTAAVWTGYDNKFEHSLVGEEQRIAQRIFKEVITYVSKDIDTPDFTMPSSVEKVTIEVGTIPAKLAGPNTPPDKRSVEYAVKGHGPTEVSTAYDKLEPPSGFSATYDENTNEIALSWNHSNEEVEFELYVSKDGAGETLLTKTKEKQARFQAEIGSTYQFRLIAVLDGLRSDPVTATVSTGETKEEEEEQQEEEEPQEEEQPDENEQQDEQQNGNNEGNGQQRNDEGNEGNGQQDNNNGEENPRENENGNNNGNGEQRQNNRQNNNGNNGNNGNEQRQNENNSEEEE